MIRPRGRGVALARALVGLLIVLVTVPSASASASAGGSTGLDPRGVYLNRFTGEFSGTEWFQVIPGDGPDRFRLTDIRGGGFDATVEPDGQVRFDGGSGRFTGDDGFVLRPFGGAFTFRGNRVPFTDAGFPLVLDGPPRDGEPALAGTFDSRTRFIDAQTGEVRSTTTETVQVGVSGTTMRITDPAGLFFQGVFTGPGAVGFRQVAGAQGRFASFPGSRDNLGQDMLGVARFEGPDRFTATILLQSRTLLGAQTQTLVRFAADRLG